MVVEGGINSALLALPGYFYFVKKKFYLFGVCRIKSKLISKG